MDETEGMTDAATEGAVTESPTGGSPAPDAGAATAPAAPATQQPQQPQQPQGPDWSQLQKYGDFETLQRQAEWFNGFAQKYSDPAFAQKFDQLYNGPGQQQAHPYDWMMGDEARMQALREQGEQHPDFPRLQQEFTNFFQNPIGQMANMINHPKVVEAMYGAMQPMLQDFVSRAMQPMQQYLHQQGEQQFRQQYEKAWLGLPDHIKQAAMQSRFGDWNGNRQQAIVNAIEFARTLPKAAPPAAEGAGQPTPDAKTVNKNTAKTPEPSKGGGKGKGAEEFEREYAKALAGSK